MSEQLRIIEALLKPEGHLDNPDKLELIQTHISFIVMTNSFVYKIKKAVNFGFLDFSTLEKRKNFCEKELELNKRLCPNIYLAVLPINKADSIRINGPGKTIEYALKMKRLSQERIMTLLLKKDKVSKKTIDLIAKLVSDFHSKAKTTPEISKFGSLPIVKTNWDENFAQTKKYFNQTITQAQFLTIKRKIDEFLDKNISLLQKRIINGHIKDCHGDLHSGNIFLTDDICIFDAIEFNDRFRYSDVASDVAFLAMDLDFQKKPELAKYFIDKYIEYSKDGQLLKLLPFYKCYRAYVRGKVVSFRLDDENIDVLEKESSLQEAKAYFDLAEEYSKNI